MHYVQEGPQLWPFFFYGGSKRQENIYKMYLLSCSNNISFTMKGVRWSNEILFITFKSKWNQEYF